MERMINERIMHYIEKRGLVTKYQSGFRRGRSTMDPVLCLEDDIRKAQGNKETLAAEFFDVEKASDMLRREGLLIKMHRMGIEGNLFNWVMDSLRERVIQVKIGSEVSGSHVVENGTPQGSVRSPTLFTIMINDIFEHIPTGMGRSLFADDGAIWKKRGNTDHLVKKLQEGRPSGNMGSRMGF